MNTTINRSCCLRWFGLVGLLVLTTQSFAGGDHAHGSADHGHGHDSHDDAPSLVYTHYSDSTELFVEFPPLVVNEPSTFVAHFTRLDNFKPLTSGTLDVHLQQNGNTTARFRVKSPASTGIFLPRVTAKKPGDYQLLLEIQDKDIHATHDLGRVTVFPNKNAIKIAQEAPEGEINYLKEQQWANPFAITRAEPRSLRPSVPGFATVSAPAEGYVIVRAPSDGYFTAKTWVNPGESIIANQLLGTLTPRLGEGEDIGQLQVNQEKARAHYQLAKEDVSRLQDLYDQGAIPEKRLQTAKQAFEVARVEWQTAQRRLQQQTEQGGTAGIVLKAPIAGIVVDASVRPDAFVQAGDALFTIADDDKRWLDIQIPEKFAHSINNISGVWLINEETPQVLDSNNDAKIVKVSQQIDPASRTVSATLQYSARNGPKLLGSRFAVMAYIDAPQSFLSIPASAIIDDSGQPVVYVQTGGELFTRRNVTTGIQDGAWVQIIQGIDAGEWVVSQGAYYVKLAATGADAIGHGHTH